MENSRLKPNKAQIILRRFAPRTLRVLERHAAGSPALASFQHTLEPAATAFIAAYDAANNASTSGGEEVIAGLQAIDTLQRLVRSWLGPLSRDLPRFDPNSVVERLAVPDDVIGTAERLLDLVRERQANAAAALPYHDDLVASLSGAIESAVKSWGAHQAALVQQDALRAQARQTAAAFEQELVAFHRALRNTIGTSHRDYQSLRYPRNAQVAVVAVDDDDDDDDDDDAASIETEPVQPRSTNGASTTVPSTGVVRA